LLPIARFEGFPLGARWGHNWVASRPQRVTPRRETAPTNYVVALVRWLESLLSTLARDPRRRRWARSPWKTVVGAKCEVAEAAPWRESSLAMFSL
jgi:hypothetical protein